MGTNRIVDRQQLRTMKKFFVLVAFAAAAGFALLPAKRRRMHKIYLLMPEIDGQTVIPKGAHVTGKVVHVKKTEIKVELRSVTLHGKSYDLQTNSRRPSDKVQVKSSDKSKEKKTDNSVLGAKTELIFKLSRPVTVPAKG